MRITIFTAIVVAILAGLIPLAELAALANAGTLTAFIAVAVCMLVMRRARARRRRAFRTPWAWPVGLVAILGCLYLFYSLPFQTQKYFLIWNAVGLVVYLLYGFRRSLLAEGAPDPMQYAGLIVGAVAGLIASPPSSTIRRWRPPAVLALRPPAHGVPGAVWRRCVIGSVLFAAGLLAERRGPRAKPARTLRSPRRARGGCRRRSRNRRRAA